MSPPPLALHERQNACAYVVRDDLADVRELVKKHRAELDQWRARDGLSLSRIEATIVALLMHFRGLRSGREGCGIQIPDHVWIEVLGCSRRGLYYAFDRLQAKGLIRRRPRSVVIKEGWTDASGRAHGRAQIISATYLTALGAARVERYGKGTRMQRWVRTPRGTVRHAYRAVVGLVGSLFKTLSRISKVISKRVASPPSNCTPSVDPQQSVSFYSSSRGCAPVEESASRTDQTGSGPPERGRGANASARGSGRWEVFTHRGAASAVNAEIKRIRSEGLRGADQLWPTEWEKAGELQRMRLVERFERYRAVVA